MRHIHLLNPTIKRKDMDAVLTCLVNDKIGPGEATSKFVNSYCSKVSHYNGFAFRDPSKAVRVILKALVRDEKSFFVLSPLLPSFYFEAFSDEGVSFKLCDVNPDNGLLDFNSVSELIDENCCGVFLYSVLGNYVDVNEFKSLSVPLIEDITTSFGLSVDDKFSGSFSDFSICSLEEDSVITSGGGVVFSANNRSNFGKIKAIVSKMSKESFLPDMNSALSDVQIASISKNLKKRKEIYDYFSKAFLKNRHSTLKLEEGIEGFFYAFPVFLDMGFKEAKKYAAKKYVDIDLAFKDVFLFQGDFDCPNALSFVNRCVIFPLYPTLLKRECEVVAKVISTIP